MKISDYFFASLILGMLALVTYGFINYFGIMVGLIAFSSVFNFIVFLIKTKTAMPNPAETFTDKPVDSYIIGNSSTYYRNEYSRSYTIEHRSFADTEQPTYVEV